LTSDCAGCKNCDFKDVCRQNCEDTQTINNQ
jgi:hypothetical protein